MIPSFVGRLAFGTLAVLAVSLTVFGRSSHETPQQETGSTESVGFRDFPTWKGVGSCAASA
ncbi:MAG TPA: hypothetical protein VGZ25_06570, partial [Gemmataceae bacterium]|nr:hypothetical protein [Gemmataceae bacterium]